MSNEKYAKTGWKKKAKTFDVELPSGQTCQVKKLDMKSIVKAGLVARLDTFTPQLLPGGTNTPGASANSAMLDIMKDSKRFEEFEQVVDEVIMACVVQPRIHPNLPEGYDRDEDKVYLDDIDFEDKIIVFGAVFQGVGDMSQFREGQVGDLVGVEEKPADAGDAEPDAGVRAGDA